MRPAPATCSRPPGHGRAYAATPLIGSSGRYLEAKAQKSGFYTLYLKGVEMQHRRGWYGWIRENV
jgi:hypothetical protein